MIDTLKNDQGKQIIRYNVDLPSNTYLGLGYGWGMKNKDMFALIAGQTQVRVEDLFSFGEVQPIVDPQQDYTIVS